MKSLFVATPCYNGQVHVNFMRSVLGLQNICTKENIRFEFFTIPFDSLIPRARNVCVKAFLDSSCDTMIFIDADIQFIPIQVVDMLKHEKDIICGAYPKKIISFDKIKACINETKDLEHLISQSTNYAINYSIDESNMIKIENNLTEVKDAPTGFLMVKKKVYHDIMEKFPNEFYTNDITAYVYGKKYYNFFPCGKFDDSDRYLSEDYGFCRVIQKLNYKVFCDISVKLNHIGQFTFTGDLVEQLKKIQEATKNS